MSMHREVAAADRRSGPARSASRARVAAVAFAVAIAAALAMAGAAWASGHEVVSWGNDEQGQLGNGKEGPLQKSAVPVYVCAPSGCAKHLQEVIAVSAGGHHSLALLSNHEVVAWGHNEEGALGDGTLTNSDLPVYVCAIGGCGNGHLKEVEAIAAGDHNSNLALLKDGQVVSWGSNKAGQLGNGTPASNTSYKEFPVNVCAPKPTFTTCGPGEYLEGVSAVSAAPDHDAAILKPNGELLTWGVNMRGQLGQGDWSKYTDIPQHVCEVEYTYVGKVAENTLPICPAGHYLTGVESITFGLEHNVAQFSGPYCVRVRKKGKEASAIDAEKGGEGEKCKEREIKKGEEEYEWIEEYAEYSVVAFGNNEEGQLGDGLAVKPPWSPHTGGPAYCRPEGGYKSPCSQVPIHVCEPEWGPLGTSPCALFEYLEPVKNISAGGAHSLALQLFGPGEVLSWGENQYGVVGAGSLPSYTCAFNSRPCSPVPWHVRNPTNTGPLTEITEISGGGYHDLALKGNTGEVYAWGAGPVGQLGNGSSGASNLPVYVCAVNTCSNGHLKGATAISAGLDHSLAIGKFGLSIEPCNPCIVLKGNEVINTKLAEPFVGPLHAGGGEPPYSWKVIAGGLPTGLTLDEATGVISGTPTELGESTFTVQVTDSSAEPEIVMASLAIIVTTPPDLGRCVKALSPKLEATTYTNKGCTLPSEEVPGGYEWLPGVEEAGFSTTSIEPATLETAAGVNVTCTGESGHGEYSGTDAVANVVMKLTGCESHGIKCTTTGLGEGELQTATLEGVYGWEVKAKQKVALDLYPAGGVGAFLEYGCGEGPSVTVNGSVLVPVKAGKTSTTTTLKFKGRKGKQKPLAFEGGEQDVLISSIGENATQTALTLTATQTSEEPVEVNAVA